MKTLVAKFLNKIDIKIDNLVIKYKVILLPNCKVIPRFLAYF